MSHQDQAKGLEQAKDWEKVWSHQRAITEDKVPICYIGLVVDFWKTQRGSYIESSTGGLHAGL